MRNYSYYTLNLMTLNRKLNINPFLLEMIMVILYLIFASVLLLRLFTISKYYNVEAVNKSEAVLLAKNLAEDWKSGTEVKELIDKHESVESEEPYGELETGSKLTYGLNEHYLDDSDIKVLDITVYADEEEVYKLRVGRLDRE